ncbi:unnamed protein product [Clonostachys rhizophaga]|uniref:DUF4267 domain-containing protein n=1 Tax=Clonostachys rhizophaga TaxID=160324 RepID=A0A9N9YQE0_9HYPO|nr:unnamed protein product [Clonostachys rhizophaga]
MSFRSHLDIITGAIGTLLVGSGLYGVVSPAKMGRAFGVIDVTRDMAVFYPGIGGRNISAGLAVWAMTFTGQRRALGTFLICWMCTGIADTYVLLTHWKPVDTVWLHVFNTFALGLVGTTLLEGSLLK